MPVSMQPCLTRWLRWNTALVLLDQPFPALLMQPVTLILTLPGYGRLDKPTARQPILFTPS